jgi:hypothetical protein
LCLISSIKFDIMTINVMQHVIGYIRFALEHLPLCQRITLPTKIYCSLLLSKIVQLVAKKSGNEHFPNVNLILSICKLIVYLTIPIK